MVRPFAPSDDADDDIAKFYDAIRQKPGWPFKLLDEPKGIAVKWAMEAQLLDDEQGINDVTLPVVQALRDLKAEASRIVALDYASQLLQPSVRVAEGQREIPFGKTDGDVANAVKFARRSKYFATQPVELKEKLGVFVTDDLSRRDTDPYVGDISHVNPGVLLPEGRAICDMPERPLRLPFSSRFPWIPSVFRITDDGTDVRIESYINGLASRERYPHLYWVVEKVFLALLPQLERAIEWKFEYEETAPGKSGSCSCFSAKNKKAEEEAEAKRRAKYSEQQIRELEHASEFYSLDDSAAAVPEKYRGRPLKVIVKCTLSKPTNSFLTYLHSPRTNRGYYYEADPSINDEGLSFRDGLKQTFPTGKIIGTRYVDPRYVHAKWKANRPATVIS
ncbi:4-coumarate CoA ligase [Salix suchowensis]|nr:4-coumarate CoA ligase [Salix suchowensis]